MSKSEHILDDDLLSDLAALDDHVKSQPGGDRTRHGMSAGLGAEDDPEADAFMDDLDDLFGDDGDDSDGEGADDPASEAARLARQRDAQASQLAARDLAELDTQHLEISDIAKLTGSARFSELTSLIDTALSGPPPVIVGNLSDHQEYNLILRSNRLALEIDDEMDLIHKYLLDYYKPKFPELASLVASPVEYARTILLIGDETDMSKVDLGSLLPPATVIVVATARINAEPGPGSVQMRRVREAATMMVSLSEASLLIVRFIQSRMAYIAPNLHRLLGATVAAQLMTAAGGIEALARMPSSNIQILGHSRRTPQGLASTGTQHMGFIFQAPAVREAPALVRRRVARQIAGKTALVARVDAFRQSSDGSVAIRYLDDLASRIERWMEPGQAKREDILPVPEENKRKRRGGRRARKQKEVYQMTQLRKAQNRSAFGQAEEEIIGGDGDLIGLGMINQGIGASGQRIRVDKKTQVKSRKARDELLRMQTQRIMPSALLSQSGVASTYSFTAQRDGGFTTSATPAHQANGIFTGTQGATGRGTTTGGATATAPAPGVPLTPAERVRQANEKWFGNKGFGAGSN
ncbi:hypothetical protein H696_00610 [Fonticula alba]|uniref:Nop domain-containing protein n=1 Tax=Fonticula alba TaxID=691883 RepID=A0A058ZFD5_FONAL|nr:hypothetical protein H696_00610 [Fonticula alba]KCV73064.1 hypothetical protein H696_00610 [Fonticula alba]|eukprot:XP_009492765.1 hypothetical protein H696_00610 [Fonticula alba]